MLIKYFIYARKSSESEDRQMASIEDQIKETKRVADNLNLPVVDVIFESKSAKEPGRKKFNEMLKRIQRGEAQGILCWKLNRLARNPVDGGQISWLLQQNVIKHIQTHGSDYKPSDNVLMMQVEFGMANQYVKDLSVDIRRGLRNKAIRGWFPGSKPPLGYMHNPDKQYKNGKEVICSPESYMKVKKLWKLMLTGKYSVAGIVREAERLGLRNSQGRPYSKQTFFGMFNNEFYYGYFQYKDEEGNSHRIKGKHKPMITHKQFQDVRKILSGNSFQYPKTRVVPFAYSRLITCGDCGHSITPDRKLQAICPVCKHKFSIKNRSVCPICSTDIRDYPNASKVDRTYLRCTKYKSICKQRSIQPDELERQVLRILADISIDEEAYGWAIKCLKQFQSHENKAEQVILVQLKKRESELQARLDSLVQLRADGEISSEQMRKTMEQTEQEIHDTRCQISDSKKSGVDWLKLAEGHMSMAVHAEKKFKNSDISTKRAMVQKLLSNLTLNGKKLEYTTQKTTFAVAECVEVYKRLKPTIEPKKSVVTYNDLGDLHPLRKVLWSKLNALRTYHIGNSQD